MQESCPAVGVPLAGGIYNVSPNPLAGGKELAATSRPPPRCRPIPAPIFGPSGLRRPNSPDSFALFRQLGRW